MHTCVYPHIHRGEISKPRYQTLITVFTFKGGDCLCKEGNRTSLYHFLNWQHYEWRLIWFAFQCFLHFKMCVYICTCVYGLHACACVCAHLCVCLILSNDMCTFITSLTVEFERTGSAILVSQEQQSRAGKVFGWRIYLNYTMYQPLAQSHQQSLSLFPHLLFSLRFQR